MTAFRHFYNINTVSPMRKLTLADFINQDNDAITLDGKEYIVESLSERAKSYLDNIEFVNERILLKNNELQIADSARIVYTSALREELIKTVA